MSKLGTKWLNIHQGHRAKVEKLDPEPEYSVSGVCDICHYIIKNCAKEQILA